MQNQPEQDSSVKRLDCPKCSRRIGRIIDDVCLAIGEARFFNDVRFSCQCGKPIYFRTKNFDISGFEGDTKQILNGLGYNRKFKKQRTRRKE